MTLVSCDLCLHYASRDPSVIRLQGTFTVKPQSPQSHWIAQHVVYVPLGKLTLSKVYRSD